MNGFDPEITTISQDLDFELHHKNNQEWINVENLNDNDWLNFKSQRV